MAFLPDKGAIALELAIATVAALHRRGVVSLDDVEASLRSKAKGLAIDESPDIDGALEALQDLREGR